jgi:hypothetical protein
MDCYHPSAGGFQYGILSLISTGETGSAPSPSEVEYL